MIDTSLLMCDRITELLCKNGMEVEVVNNKVTVDSVVEHEIDLDVVHDDYIWNIRVNVVRFYRKSAYDAEVGHSASPQP